MIEREERRDGFCDGSIRGGPSIPYTAGIMME